MSNNNPLPRYNWHTLRPMTDFTYWEPSQERVTALERELAEAKAREERLLAHIQEAADDASKNSFSASENGDAYAAAFFLQLRDWHLAALQQYGDTHGQG